MVQRTRFLGLDVHKDTIAAAICEETGRAQSYGTIANDPAAIRKLVRAVGGGKAVRLVAAYEAGPTGFVLQRQLARLRVEWSRRPP
jgi:transposase